MHRFLGTILFTLFLIHSPLIAEPYWTYQVPDDAPFCLAALPDITGDQLPEIVAGYNSGLIVCVASGKKPTPVILWKVQIKGSILAIQTIIDTSPQNTPMVVAATDQGNIVCVSASPSSAGKILWMNKAVFNISSLVLLKDMNRDGINEVAYGGADHRVTLVNGKNGKLIWSRLFQGNAETPFVDCITNAGDINGDNLEDLFVRTWGAERWAISGADGSNLWSPKQENPFLSTLLTAKDLTGDGVSEFLESGNDGILYLCNGKDGLVIWNSQWSRPVRAIAISDDVTGDGIFDCYAGTAEGEVVCISGAGLGKVTTVWSKSLGDVCRVILPLGDINQDGKPDVIAGSENGLVAAYSGVNGDVLWQWQGPDVVKTILPVGDVDKDGITDLAVALLDGSLVLLPGKPETPSKTVSSSPKKYLKPDRKRTAPSREEILEVPILLYHDVPPQAVLPGLSSPLQNFKNQMEFLDKEGYHSVSLEEIAEWIEGKINLPPKPFCITFDGQYTSHYTYLAAILKQHGFFGISYITTDWIGSSNHLDWNQLRSLEHSGIMDIENHTINHAVLSQVPKAEIVRQVTLSNNAIRDHLEGKISTHHTYPSGVNNPTVREVMKEVGFRTATAVQDRKAVKSDNLYSLPRYTISENMNLASFKAIMRHPNPSQHDLPYEYAGTVGERWQQPSYGEVDRDGRLWICDLSANRVRVFLPDGKEAPFSPIQEGIKQSGDTIAMRSPSGIAVTPSGDVLVSISSRFGTILHGGLFRYRAVDGKMLPGIDLPYYPGDVDIDAKGLIYVVDKISEQWYVYSPEGQLVPGGHYGQNNGYHIQRGISVTPDGKRVYLISDTDHNVKVWEGQSTLSSANYTRKKNLVEELTPQSSSVDVMDDGTVWVSYFSEGMIVAFDKNHRILGQISGGRIPSLSGPRGIAFDPDGKNIWVISLFGQVQHWKKKP